MSPSGDFALKNLQRRAHLPAAEIASLVEQISADLLADAPEALVDYPLGSYLDFFDLLPENAHYHAVPPQARGFADAIELAGGPAALEAYNRLATLRLIESNQPRTALRLTAEVDALRAAYVARVLADIAAPRKGFFRHSNDMFAKDFAVCRGLLLPCGAELVDPRGGVPRRLLLQGGVRQVLSALRLLTRAGGFAPLWGLHFDRRLIGEFNEAGYTALYLRLADLLAVNPDVRGVMSSSWWHDPALSGISPELAFIGRHPESSGAVLLRVGEDAVATVDATRFAKERASLHRQGVYRPCVYLLAWPRNDLLTWARDYRARASPQRSVPLAS
jgi:hypothetical protein